MQLKSPAHAMTASISRAGRTRRLAQILVVAVCVVAAWIAMAPLEQDAAAQPGARTWRAEPPWTAGFDPGALLEPAGVDAGAANFYVADKGHDRVAVIDPAGGVVATIGSPGVGPGNLRQPTDVAVDTARDRLYVADRGNKRINVFDLSGRPLDTWTTAGPQFSLVPHAVAAAPSGDVYVLSRSIVSRIEHYRSDGTWVNGWGENGVGPGQFTGPQDLTVLGDGSLLVADSGNGQLHQFSSDGAVMGPWLTLENARAVDFSAADGRVYALHGAAADRIGVYGPGGTEQTILDSNSLAPGARFRPAQGLAAGDDRLAVTTGSGAVGGAHGLRQYALAGLSLASTNVTDPRDHAGFFRPVALDVDAGGQVHVADPPIAVVKRYGPNGSFADRLETGPAEEIAVAPDGMVFTAEVRQFARLRAFSSAGAWQWDKACDCLSGMGLAAVSDRILATDALSRTVQVFDRNPDREEPVSTGSIGDPPYLWPMDLATAPDGNVAALDSLGRRVHILDSNANVVRSFSLPGSASRIDVSSEGTLFVLYLDGTIAAHRPNGTIEHQWRVAALPGAAWAKPIDLAAAPDGTVYVIDGETWSIRPYRPQSGVPSSPTPPPTAQPPCVAEGTKAAGPRQISLADTAAVTLTLNITCQAGSETRADVILIMDRSSSMAAADCGKLCDAQAAAKSFVGGLDLARHRVGLVSFSESVTLDLPLTANRGAIDAAIDAVQAAGNTNIADALELATTHMQSAARPDALPVYLLLTDGDPSGREQAFADTVAAGMRANALGGLVYSVGLGANVRAELLSTVAGSPSRYFFAPTPSDLKPIYDRLSESIGDITASNVVLDDSMGPDVEYVAGSASGSPLVTQGRLVWDIGTVPAGGLTFTYRVRPLLTGTLPTNTRAAANYIVEGTAHEYVYQIPEIEVVGLPTDAPTPTETKPPTVTPTARPTEPGTLRHAYLPIAMQQVCLLKDRRLGTDIVLVMDVSSSMSGAKLDAAKQAAQHFVSQVDPRRDRVGVVAFDADAHLIYLITADLASVQSALEGLRSGAGTRIDLGLAKALQEIDYRARPGSQRILVLLSDGVPTPNTADEALAMAAAARDRGIRLFTIGLAPDADMPFLEQLAGRPDQAFFSPTPEDLTGIYATIAARLPCR